MAQNITLSISGEDAQFLKEHPNIRPSQLFRRACQMYRAHELDVELFTFEGLIDEIVRQRNAISAATTQRMQLMKELKALKEEKA